MELIFLRHAQPEWTRDGRSVQNPPLTELGRVQARLLASASRQWRRPSELLISPTLRTRQTAEPLREAMGMEGELVPFFQEIRLPKWDGAPADFVETALRAARQRPQKEWWDGIPGGESFRDFHQRITEGLVQLLASRGVRRAGDEAMSLWHVDNPEQRLMFVGHAGSNSVALTLLLDVAPVPWEWERFSSQHASVTRVKARQIADGYVFCLRSFSVVEHLPRDMHTK